VDRQIADDPVDPLIQFFLQEFVLIVQIEDERLILNHLPAVDPINFVQSYDEWGLVLLQYIDRFYGLGFQSFHDINDQNGEIRQRSASCSQ